MKNANVKIQFQKAIFGIFTLCSIFGLALTGLVLNNKNVQAAGEYNLPWPQSATPYRVTQGNGEAPSHLIGTKAEFAVDFALPEGTPISAVRGGQVSRVYAESSPTDCGGIDFLAKANYVVIDHGDGTSALYLNLSEVYVRKDDLILKGQIIGESGSTGYTAVGGGPCVPHLHFQLQKTGAGWQQSLPVSFNDVVGGIPKRGAEVISQNTIPGTTGLAAPETFLFDLRNSAVSSKNNLKSGVNYLVKITGTFSYWDDSDWNNKGICSGKPDPSPMFLTPGISACYASSDIFGQFSVPNNTSACDSKLQLPAWNNNIKYSANGTDFYSFTSILDGFKSSHVYERKIIGEGKPLILLFYDTYYQDNCGQLKVEIIP